MDKLKRFFIKPILIILIIILLLLFLTIWGWMCLTDSYTDYGLSRIVISSLNNKKNLKKYSGDKKTYNLLKKKLIIIQLK